MLLVPAQHPTQGGLTRGLPIFVGIVVVPRCRLSNLWASTETALPYSPDCEHGFSRHPRYSAALGTPESRHRHPNPGLPRVPRRYVPNGRNGRGL